MEEAERTEGTRNNCLKTLLSGSIMEGMPRHYSAVVSSTRLAGSLCAVSRHRGEQCRWSFAGVPFALEGEPFFDMSPMLAHTWCEVDCRAP